MRKKFLFSILALALISVVTMSFVVDTQTTAQDTPTEMVTTDIADLVVEAPLNHVGCCPSGWTLFEFQEGDGDPARKWDEQGNQDGYICFKNTGNGGGNGNDPLFNGNVKDNNQKCK